MQQAALVKMGHRVSPPKDLCHQARRQRYRLRRVAQELLKDEAIGRCGRAGYEPVVAVRATPGQAAYGGVVHCRRKWDCPHCSHLIGVKIREQVHELIEAHRRAGGMVYMSAFTVPHTAFDHARELRCTVANLYRKLAGGAPWQRATTMVGFLGSVRAMEVTHGGNGWHPHLHVLYFFAPGTPQVQIETFGVWLFERWARLVQRAGLGRCSPDVWQFERARSTERAGNYVTKWGSEWELVGGAGKKAKNGNRSPWDLLDAASRGDRRAAYLFREYSKAFKGARQLTWTKGLRERYELREPGSEEDFDLEELVGNDVGIVSNPVYCTLVHRRLDVSLLEALEKQPSWQTVLDFCALHGIRLDERCRARSRFERMRC